MLAKILSRYWWMTLIRGLTWILFGIIVFVQPLISLVTLTLAFGAFVFADGAGHIASAIGGRPGHGDWWVLLLAGLCGVGVGILSLVTPGVTALTLLFYIGAWAVATGLLEIVAAIRLRKEIEGEVWLALAGLISIAFGGLLLVRPGAGVLSVLWLVAGYSIVLGSTLVALAFKVRGFEEQVVAKVKSVAAGKSR